MADLVSYTVKAPDGNTIQLQGPAGASQDEVISQAQRLYAAQKQSAPQSIQDKLMEYDRKQPSSAPQPDTAQPSRLVPSLPDNALGNYARVVAASLSPALAISELMNANDQTGQGRRYVLEQYKKGVASGLGLPVDTFANALNLGIAGYGVGKHELTGSIDLPEPISNPFGGSGTMEKLLMVDNGARPAGPISRVTGRVAHDLGSATVPVAGMAGMPEAMLANPTAAQLIAARTQNPLPILAAGAATTTSGALGGEAGRAIAPAPYKESADVLGQILGGVVLPAASASRLQALQDLKNAGSQENVSRRATGIVQGNIENDVRNFPGAREKLDEAVSLQNEIPGFQPRVGQASGVPSLLDMERRVATSGPENFNKRAIQDQANRQAILADAEKNLPLLNGNDLPERIKLIQDQRAALAEKLPQPSGEEIGQTLRDVRGSLKERYDQLAAEKFQAPVDEAERLRVKVDPAEIMAKADEIRSNPILKFDEGNAPAILRKIEAVSSAEVPGGGVIVTPSGKAAREMVPQKIDFKDLKGMREAINQDVARERGSPSPNARQRLRALYELQGAIDDTAAQAPASVRTLWDNARTWYRDEYAPKFLRGVNVKQSLKDVTGDLRIADERLAGQYFRPMDSTRAKAFVKLYGESPQAMNAMENHILDTYRREVVRNGVIDPGKHASFIGKYRPALDQLPDIRKGLDSIGNTAKLLGERETQLADAHSILEKGQLDRLKYDGGGPQDAIDPEKVNAFLTKNGASFKEAISNVYGDKVANSHIENLKKISKASEIADRGRLGPNTFPDQSTNPGDLRKTFGFSGRTVFNMIRAVTTGRTSAEDMIFTLGAQAGSHRMNMALIKAEERAISDPKTAQLIAESTKLPANSEAGKSNLRQILEKGGMYVVDAATGANNYAKTGKYALPSVAANLSQSGTNAAKKDEDKGSSYRFGIMGTPVKNSRPVLMPMGALSGVRG